MKILVPVWRGGCLIMDAVTKNEEYLDFEPDSVLDEGEVVCVERGSPIPMSEVCVYAEHEHQLDVNFRKAIDSVKAKFSECRIWENDVTKMAPTDKGGEGRHNLEWQMFCIVRVLGKRKG